MYVLLLIRPLRDATRTLCGSTTEIGDDTIIIDGYWRRPTCISNFLLHRPLFLLFILLVLSFFSILVERSIVFRVGNQVVPLNEERLHNIGN